MSVRKSEVTTYSDKIAGEPQNFNQAVRFDEDGGFIGITQWDSGDRIRDRVLLSPSQVKALLKFISHQSE